MYATAVGARFTARRGILQQCRTQEYSLTEKIQLATRQHLPENIHSPLAAGGLQHRLHSVTVVI